MDTEEPFQIGLRFAQMVTGFEVSDEPVDPASPLGRVLAFVAEHGEDALTPAHIIAARQGRL